MDSFDLSYAPPRFRSKVVVVPSGCWEWQAATSNGYGIYVVRTSTPKSNVLAHRFAYRWFVGEIPDGLQLDHLCRNRRCVNPAHLEAVTNAENTRRELEEEADAA